jgi:hypothetical protein
VDVGGLVRHLEVADGAVALETKGTQKGEGEGEGRGAVIQCLQSVGVTIGVDYAGDAGDASPPVFVKTNFVPTRKKKEKKNIYILFFKNECLKR